MALVDLEDLTRSITAHKGHLTRNCNALARATQFLVDHPTQFSKSEVESEIAKLRDRRNKLVNLYEEAQRMDEPDQATAYETRLNELETTYNAAIGPALVALTAANNLAAAAPLQAPPAQGAGNVQPTFKVQTALQPEKLTRDNTPAELSSWAAKFRAFYSVSKLERASIPDQQAFLLQSLDLDLETYLRQQINDTTPIYG